MSQEAEATTPQTNGTAEPTAAQLEQQWREAAISRANRGDEPEEAPEDGGDILEEVAEAVSEALAEGEEPDESVAVEAEGEEPGKGEGEQRAEPEKKAEPKRLSKRERRERYNAERQRRHAKAARRERERAEDVLRKIEEREAALNRRESEFQQWEQRARQDPIGALAQRYGLSPEQVVAMNADSQATQLDPRIQHRLDQLEQQLHQERSRRAQREQELQRKEYDRRFQSLVDQDVQFLATKTDHPAAKEDWPNFASLPQAMREKMSREAVHYWLDEDKDVHPDVIMDHLDEQARPIVEHIRGKLKSASTDEGKESRGRSSKRTKTPGRVNARAAAEPASRGVQTEAELRARAMAKADEMIRRG